MLQALQAFVDSPLSVNMFRPAPYPCTPAQFEEVLRRHPNGSWAPSLAEDAHDGGALKRGYYADQLLGYLQHFPRQQLHILLTEELFADFVGGVHALQADLGLPFVNYSHHTHVNERGFTVVTALRSKTDKLGYLPMTAGLKQRLDEHYQPHIEALVKHGFITREQLARYWHYPPPV